tara:strand:- start:606 stop:1853 length:1248 start_codon:yes stop_codon:yes gene_type:complete
MKQIFTGNFGTMELIIDDEGNAMGKYQKAATLEGTYIYNTFNGKWANKGMSGLVTFTVIDGKLSGNWKKGEEPGPMKSKWKGDLVAQEGETTPVENTPVENPLKTKVMELYESEKYAEVISLFSENETELGEDEDIVHKFLFSMWFYGGLEEETYAKIRCFEDKFQTNRWLKLKGYYYDYKQWYDLALNAFKDTSEVFYENVKKKFDSYDVLYKEEKYKEVVKYFESELRLSVSLETFNIAEYYCEALYMDSDTERKALEKIRDFRESYPDHEAFIKQNGRFAFYIGREKLDLELIEEGLACFKKLKDERNIAKTKEVISETKNKIKEKANAEKRKQREQAASEKKEAKLKQHRFKSSKGKTFCQFCARDNDFASYDCEGRRHGHNFVLMKEDGSFKPICNKCGYGYNFAEYSCN